MLKTHKTNFSAICSSQHAFLYVVPALLLLASAALYVPWLSNPLMFDDFGVLQSPVIGDYAMRPFSLTPRQFPYFTLGFEHVIWPSDWQVSRAVNFSLHGLSGFLLFLLARNLLAFVGKRGRDIDITCLLIALIFVLHPVATYAVGYLVQRTILFATFFSLLAANFFCSSLKRSSRSQAALAGIFFGAAALSKEHAITVFIDIVLIALIVHRADLKNTKKPVITFLLFALPFVGIVLASKLGLVAAPYEPDVQGIISSDGFPDQHSKLGNWLLSAALQCGFFFKYWGLWLLPRTSQMSIDIRPDFAQLASSPTLYVYPLLLGVLFVVSGVVLLKSQRVYTVWRLSALASCWAVIFFSVEMSTVRFQEPFVLYRSYLWAAGFLFAAIAPLMALPQRARIAALTLACLFLPFQTWNRLQVSSSELLLWEDAAVKLPSRQVAGVSRIIFNRGASRLRHGDYVGALTDINWVIDKNQQTSQIVAAYWARADIHSIQGRPSEAINDLERAIQLYPNVAMSYFRLGLLYQKLGKHDQALASFAMSESKGMPHFNFLDGNKTIAWGTKK